MISYVHVVYLFCSWRSRRRRDEIKWFYEIEVEKEMRLFIQLGEMPRTLLSSEFADGKSLHS
jgi:hypothetical protein